MPVRDILQVHKSTEDPTNYTRKMRVFENVQPNNENVKRANANKCVPYRVNGERILITYTFGSTQHTTVDKSLQRKLFCHLSILQTPNHFIWHT